MKQVPFLGKKTVGNPAMRKDMWAPLATVSFPSGPQGLEAYHQLREFAKRHLHEWTYKGINQRLAARGLDPLSKPDGEWGKPKWKSDRWFRSKVVGPALQDQKANSVADLAAVLQVQELAAGHAQQHASEERRLNDEAIGKAQKRIAELLEARKKLEGKDDEDSLRQHKEIKSEKMRLQRVLKKPAPHAALIGEYHVKNDTRTPAKRGRIQKLMRARNRPLTTMNGIKIEWADPLDKQYAKEWPPAIKHEVLQRGHGRSRNVPTTAITPVQAEPEVETTEIEAQQQRTIAEPEAPKGTMQRIIERLRDGSR